MGIPRATRTCKRTRSVRVQLYTLLYTCVLYLGTYVYSNKYTRMKR